MAFQPITRLTSTKNIFNNNKWSRFVVAFWLCCFFLNSLKLVDVMSGGEGKKYLSIDTFMIFSSLPRSFSFYFGWGLTSGSKARGCCFYDYNNCLWETHYKDRASWVCWKDLKQSHIARQPRVCESMKFCFLPFSFHPFIHVHKRLR